MDNMLAELNIENFRGIQNLSIKDMRRLVLLSGNNNVGKSSVLEAIFFMMDHLWYDGMALPAEIENRTSQTVSFLLNIPAVFNLKQNEKSRFQISTGLALLMRFGLLAGGVKESDSGYSGSAGSDMDKINSWFWQNARFLYFSLGASWLYTFTDHLKAGPTMNLYLPAGSFISGEGAQALIFSLGLKLCI